MDKELCPTQSTRCENPGNSDTTPKNIIILPNKLTLASLIFYMANSASVLSLR